MYNRYCSLRAYIFLSYHLIEVTWQQHGKLHTTVKRFQKDLKMHSRERFYINCSKSFVAAYKILHCIAYICFLYSLVRMHFFTGSHIKWFWSSVQAVINLIGVTEMTFFMHSSHRHVSYCHKSKSTICPKSSGPVYIVSYYIKCVTTSWTYSNITWR